MRDDERVPFDETHKMRVKMVRCLVEEPEPPQDVTELEAWCEVGKSGRPVQTHVGDRGTVLWLNDDGSLCVAFDDGDERFLFADEVELAA